MGVFNKLVNILFDETEEEIPVITKDSEKDLKKETEKRENSDDEVVVTQLEKPVKDDTLFDIPKFKEESSITHTKTFTFPVFDDDEEIIDEEIPKKAKKNKKEEEIPKSNISDFEYLSSTDYRSKKSDAYTASRNNIYDGYDGGDRKKPFTLSPIISPVYGVLNENYRKEDISFRDNSDNRVIKKVDLDSVRRKAYGTLEDEIEVSLGRNDDNVLEEVPEKEERKLLDTLSDDGLTISDLLMEEEKELDKEEVFDIEDEPNKEIEIDEQEDVDADEKKEEATEDDDLFDLIDSIYAGKDEEE